MKSLPSASSLILSSQFAEETRAFLQQRLRLMSGVLAVLLWALIALFVTSMLAGGDGLLLVASDFVVGFPNGILFWLVVVITVIHVALRLGQLGSGRLAALDGLLLQILIAPCLLLYALLHDFSFSGFAYVVPFLMLFLLARAILVPSTPLRTLLLCLPAPLGVLLIQLIHGGSFRDAGQPYSRSHFIDTIIQNQVCLLGAVALAVVASRVNLSLRRRTFDARRVGQYEVGGLLGSGAMGEVYRATHSLLKRETALKFLRPEIAGGDSLRRFEQEVKLASGLTHPNTISIYDYGYTADGHFYYAMELLDGATLKEIVLATGPLPPGRVIHLLAQACGALYEAHRQGILHRDIKPANIMVCERGGEPDRVKILDFGLAHRLGPADGFSSAGRREVSGTPETMAPEVWQGEVIGPAADLYALAVVGYRLLTGVAPFEAEAPDQLAVLHAGTEPRPIRERDAQLPADLEAVILRGMRKDPAERFTDAAAMRQALLACEATGTWTEEQARKWWPEHPDLASEPASDPSESTISSMETMVLDE